MNAIPTLVPIAVPIIGIGVVCGAWYWMSPSYTDVGYQPEQPVAFSHRLHAGELGMDCRYCHNTVEAASYAAVPPTETCMNCHKIVGTDSEKLAQVRQSYETGEPIPWVKVHQLPDYAYFAHNVHLAAGVGCESCHGRIDRMEKVTLSQSLSMGWCLDCHRNPGPHLRPKTEITSMGYLARANGAVAPHHTNTHNDFVHASNGRKLVPPENCSGCHR